MKDYLDVRQVTKHFGATRVLDRLDLAVGRGEFLSLLGPSGCGKTTLLRLIAGLMVADSGRIAVDGRDLTGLPAHKRNIGVVFQNYALFPHLTVADNVAFGLRAQRVAKAEIPATIDRSLRMVHMPDLAKRPIHSLSGGQQQRVAVARALAVRPSLLLLDEPFSALDRKLRETMQIELRQLLRELAITAVFVTHDQEEAMVMSDRIAVMNSGTIEQLADPQTIYNQPATSFALEFVGASTRLPGTVAGQDGAHVDIDTAVGRVRGRGAFMRGAKVTVGIRPERIGIAAANGSARNTVDLVVADRVFLGSKLFVHFDVGAGGQGLAELNSHEAPAIAAGQRVAVSWAVSDTLIYPERAPP